VNPAALRFPATVEELERAGTCETCRNAPVDAPRPAPPSTPDDVCILCHRVRPGKPMDTGPYGSWHYECAEDNS